MDFNRPSKRDNQVNYCVENGNTQTNVEVDTTNKEQNRVIEKLKKVLDFLEHVQIKNEESLTIIEEPLDDLLSNLKYLPVDESFGDLPIEIKTNILSYLCDSGAFVAATVCQEWKSILKGRLNSLDEINIGKCCSNKSACINPCEDGFCFLPEETLKSSMILKLDIPLSVCYPLIGIDSKLISRSLASLSNFSVVSDCHCKNDTGTPIMTKNQIKDLVEELGKNTEIVRSIDLQGFNMTHINQDEVAKCLLKINSVSLAQVHEYKDEQQNAVGLQKMLNMEIFIKKLLEDSVETKLNCLYLDYMELPDELSIDLADALCKVSEVYLGKNFYISSASITRIIEKILRQSAKVKRLTIMENIDWFDLINVKNLKILLNMMDIFEIWGVFTSQQVKGARSIRGVKAIKDYDEETEEIIFRIIKS